MATWSVKYTTMITKNKIVQLNISRCDGGSRSEDTDFEMNREAERQHMKLFNSEVKQASNEKQNVVIS